MDLSGMFTLFLTEKISSRETWALMLFVEHASQLELGDTVQILGPDVAYIFYWISIYFKVLFRIVCIITCLTCMASDLLLWQCHVLLFTAVNMSQYSFYEDSNHSPVSSTSSSTNYSIYTLLLWGKHAPFTQPIVKQREKTDVKVS